MSMRTRRPAAERGDGLGGIGAEGVAGVKVAYGLVVESHPEAGDAGLGRAAIPASVSGRMKNSLEEGFVAEHACVAFDGGAQTAAGEIWTSAGGAPGEIAGAGGVDDGVGEGMVGALFGGGGEAEEIVSAGRPARRMDGCEDGAADGESAGFVEDDGVEVSKAFEGFAAFEEDAELRAAAYGNGECGGNGEAHGAGAGDDEYGDGVGEGERERVRGDEPDDEGERGEGEDDGDKDGAGAVGQALHGRAGALGLLDHAGDLGEDGGFAEGPARQVTAPS